MLDVKRASDVIIAAIALAATSPILIAAATAIRICLGPPIFFRQVRPGLHGRPFTLIKFRTMLAIDSAQGAASDRDRLTPLGRTLRATSVDELPTLLNVLRGDMSIVGPRPLLSEYLPLYSVEQSRRHEVRPGVTGLAQVSGRNSLTWSDKLALDVEYVDHRSLRLDGLIVWRTIGKVLSRENVSHPGEATMPRFTGEQE
jgi:lipopolysaccharide/colanic/teichoic acid biosynthesis glycosyltransferase